MPSRVLRAARAGLAALLLALGLIACQPATVQQQEAYVFGTRVEVIVAERDPEQARRAIAIVLREFDRLHQTYHAWKPSELTALNTAIAAGKPYPVSAELAGLLRDAQAAAQRGDYLFDPGIGRLIALWGFQSDEFKPVLPDPAAIAAWLKSAPSIRHLRIADDGTVTSSNREVAVDFGGLLKGWALDRAATLLREQGIHHALINIGGNVMALGDKFGRPWRVGIQHPRQPGPLATLELHDGEAIGTSGDYQRYFELDGIRYAHLLDPRTGAPGHDTQAVTVLIPASPQAGLRSDVSSKPIYIGGRDEWSKQAANQDVAAVLRVDAKGSIQVSKTLASRLEFTDRQTHPELMP